MPGLMVHLLTARKFSSNPSVAFMVGNVAPDSVHGWKEKDESHFRDRPDRLSALRELATSADISSDFSKGVILHLFLDYYWDINPRDTFIKNYTGEDWFPAYRNEIALSSAWLYHNKSWSTAVWDEMAAYPVEKYDDVHRLVRKDVFDLIQWNRDWHIGNNIGPSIAFSPEFIEEFTDRVASDFALLLSKPGDYRQNMY